MTAPSLQQLSFRARGDTVGLNVDTWDHALNANFSQDVDTNFRVRFTVVETAGGMANNIAFSLQYNNITTGSGFLAIGDTAPVKSSISAQFTNADPTTQLISTGTFVAGAGYEQTTTSNISLQSNRTEIEWCLSIDSTQVANGDQIQLRIVQDTGTVLQFYTQIPTITVVEAAAFAASQTAYRFAEDGTESGATLIGTLNTTLVRNVTADSNLQLRVRLQETGGVAGGATDDYQLQRAINGGAFASVTAASTAVKINTASALTDGAATTNRLGAGSGSFVAGEQEESDGLVDDHQLTASNFTEHVWALTLVAAEVAAADSLTFRVLRNGSVITYSVTPTITVETTIPTITSIDTDNDTVDTRTGVVIVGTNFEASETGVAKVEISNNATPGAGTVVEIDVTSWSATSITATLRQESDAAALATLLTLPLSPAYLWVTNSLGGQNPTGFQFTLRPPGATVLAAVNTDAEIDAGTIFLIRFRVENTGGEGVTGFKLKRSHNGGGYEDVTTISTVAEAVAAVAFADGDDVIETLGGSGTYIVDNNAGSEDGGFTLTANFPASGAVEAVFAVRIVEEDVADTDTVAFRVYNGDDTALTSYTVTPTITVNEATGATEVLSFGLDAGDTATAAAAVDEALTEAAVASDAVAAAAEVDEAIAEAAALADAAAAVAAATESTTETVTAGDAASSVSVAVETLAESAAFADTETEVVTASGVADVAISTAVAATVVAVVDESTAEAVTAEAVVAVIAEATEAITEAAALADASTAVQDLDGAFDAPLITDFVTVGALDTGAAVDAAATFDAAETATAEVVAATTEPVALGDAATALAAVDESLSEPAALADVATAAQALAGSLDAALVADTSQLSDSDAAEVVTEAATMTDAAAADVDAVGVVTAQLVLDDVEASDAAEFPTPIGAINANVVDLVVGPTYLIVARVENTGAVGATNFRWSHNHNDAGWAHVAPAEENWSDGEEFSDGTGWFNVGAVIAVPAVTFDNDTDVPEILGGSGTYLADNNAASEDGTTTLPSNFPASGAVEFALSFHLRSGAVNNDETGQIRIELGDGADLNVYDFTMTYMVVGGVTAEELTFGLLLGKAHTAKAAVDETVDLVAALADAGTAVAEVAEALAVAATLTDAATAAAAVSEILPASALEAATAHVGISGPTGELNAPLAAGDAQAAIVAASEAVAEPLAAGDVQSAIAEASEATAEGVIAQDSAVAAASAMEAIAAGSVFDDTAIGDTASAIEIVEAVSLADTQVAAAALAADAPADALEADTAQTAVSALSGVHEEALAAGDARTAIAAASAATTADGVFDDTAIGDIALASAIVEAVDLADTQEAIAAASGATAADAIIQDSASAATELMEAIVAGSVLDEAAIGDTAGTVGIVAAVDLAGAQVAVAELSGVVPVSASFASDLTALAALTEVLVAPSAIASEQVAEAALAEVVAAADATLASDHAALSELSGAVTAPAAFAESSTSDTEGIETLAFGAALDDAEAATADLMDALTATAFLASSTTGDTASSRSVSFAIELDAAQFESVARVASLAEPMVAAVTAAELADFASVQAEPIVVQIATENAVAGLADLSVGMDLGSVQSLLADVQMLLDINAAFGVGAFSELGTHNTVTMELELASIMESTPRYIDPILGARFGAINLAARRESASLSARFQY